MTSVSIRQSFRFSRRLFRRLPGQPPNHVQTKILRSAQRGMTLVYERDTVGDWMHELSSSIISSVSCEAHGAAQGDTNGLHQQLRGGFRFLSVCTELCTACTQGSSSWSCEIGYPKMSMTCMSWQHFSRQISKVQLGGFSK